VPDVNLLEYVHTSDVSQRQELKIVYVLLRQQDEAVSECRPDLQASWTILCTSVFLAAMHHSMLAHKLKTNAVCLHLIQEHIQEQHRGLLVAPCPEGIIQESTREGMAGCTDQTVSLSSRFKQLPQSRDCLGHEQA